MRVLHVISTLAGGSAEQQLRLLLRRLPYESEVVTLAPAGAVAAALRAEGVPVHEVDTLGERHLTAVARLRRTIRRGGFDVVHTHLHRASVQGRLAARLAGVPHVLATEQHLPAEEHPGRPPSAGARALYLAGERLGEITIAASTAIAARLRAWGVPARRITVLPKAVDAAEFRFDPGLRTPARARLGVGPDVPVVGCVGRLDPDKRFDLLIRAIAQVPDAVLLLVGDGPARAALEQLAVIEGVSDRVLFAGAVTHPREMLCAMDVYASPHRAASGVGVLEAIAAGLPTLYASCPPLEGLAAARRAVGGTWRLTPHDPESLPRALRAELLCHAERGGARLPARSAGERYDADRLADSVTRIYEGFTRRRGPARHRPAPVPERGARDGSGGSGAGSPRPAEAGTRARIPAARPAYSRSGR